MNLAGIPEPIDIRALLEGYGLDTQTTLTLSGTWVSPSAIITGIDTTQLNKGMNIFGTGIPAAAQIAAVDIVDAVNGQITISAPTTASGTASALTVSYYCTVSDNWIQDLIDDEIKPWIEAKTRQSFDGLKTTTEYYDGTGSPIMILRRRPIVQLISISYTNVDSNLYYLTPSAMQVIAEEGILKAKANFNESSYIPIFFRGDRNIRITYQYGWAECPNDIARAMTLFAASETLQHVGSKTGGGNQGLPGISRDYGPAGKWTHLRKDMSLRAFALLRKYITGGGS